MRAGRWSAGGVDSALGMSGSGPASLRARSVVTDVRFARRGRRRASGRPTSSRDSLRPGLLQRPRGPGSAAAAAAPGLGSQRCSFSTWAAYRRGAGQPYLYMPAPRRKVLLSHPLGSGWGDPGGRPIVGTAKSISRVTSVGVDGNTARAGSPSWGPRSTSALLILYTLR